MGEKYTSVGEVYEEKLTAEEQRVLEYLGRNETRRTLVLEKKLTTDGHLPEELVVKQTQTELEILQQLLKEGWITKKTIEGRIGYRLSTKAGLRPRFTRLNSKSISHTIITLDFDAREKLHPKAHRGISLREGARLQSFPDNVHFKGDFRSVAKQIENAVPPLLAYKIAEHLAEVLGLKTEKRIQ